MTTDQQLSSTNSSVDVEFTMPFPPEELDKLLPHWHDLQNLKVIADLSSPADGSTCGLTLTVTSMDDSNQSPQPEAVCWVFQQVWNGLVSRGFVTGTMPEIVYRNLLDVSYVRV